MLKKAKQFFASQNAMRFRFVEKHRGAFQVARLGRVMNVSARGLCAFRRRPASQRQRIDRGVLTHIKDQSNRSLDSCCSPRKTEELREAGLDVGHHRVG